MPRRPVSTRGSVADLTGTFRFGIEEEYFLVDAETKAIAPTVPEALFAAAKSSTLGRGKGEFLQQQLEVATKPHVDMEKARAELRQLRHMVTAIAAPHGLAILAAGTHPTAAWTEAQQTKAERYDTIMYDLQMIGRRNMLCGLHVHVELPDPDARVDVMTRMLPYLPIFIALATSSPFWQSQRTGLLGYRLAAYDELPRTGVPELFRTRGNSRPMSTRWCAPACYPTQASSGEGCGRRPRIRRSNCAHPIAARGWRIRWRSPHSIAPWRAASFLIPGSMPISPPCRAPSSWRTSGGRSATAFTEPSSTRRGRAACRSRAGLIK